MKIVSVDKVFLYPDHIKKLKKFGEVVVYDDVPDEAEGLRRIEDAQIVIDNWYEMPKRVIAGAARLKMICVAATGYEWVDLKEAKKRKILVANSPGYGTEAVAEHAVGLLLSATRFSFLAQRDVLAGKWTPEHYKGKELKNKILGIIGFGSIGRRVAEIAKKGFEMEIISVDSQSSRKDLETLLLKSDFISINAPLNEQTRGMLGTKEFKLMKEGVVIVNTGRGAIINEEALLKYLKSGKIFGAGLDVLTKEPMDKNNPLFRQPNVVISPHIGFNTEQAELRLSATVTENIIGYLSGQPQNIVA